MKKLFSLLTIATILTSCSSDSTEDVTTPVPTSVTYTANIKAIIDQSCATTGCHNSTTSAFGLTLENYTQVKNAFQNKNALGRMESTTNPMPPNGNLPSTSIDAIKKWKAQGYIE